MRNLLTACLLILSIQGIAISQTHPRLFFSSSDITTLQNRIDSTGTPAHELWQVLKDRQSDIYANSQYWSQLDDGYVIESMISVALAFMITNDSSYLDATREIIFGDGVFDGLIYSNTVENGFRTARAGTFSIIADMLWNNFTTAEKWQIAQRIVDDIYTETRSELYSGYAHVNNNHIVRISSVIAYAAITLHDFRNEENELFYPDAINDLNRVRQLVFTDLNGHKNIREQLTFWVKLCRSITADEEYNQQNQYPSQGCVLNLPLRDIPADVLDLQNGGDRQALVSDVPSILQFPGYESDLEQTICCV